ncbi:MFS transporter [Anaerobacillus alkaliphilus]|uniref:MFS transporter n=1 Tax=Anaerobacillus alkaliphilus TaxID=1548597 RepID=A0A4Q0VRV9_9BACI|nr:MFS transporter [Anaerobacillus alkaliphilus]RXI99816.1 MFS transporter [Anaerobacillus alkaliphilus]
MLDLLKQKSFFIVWLGHASASLGNTFSAFAIAWLVYDTTGSKLAMGSIMVVFLLSRSISLLWFGPFLDGWNRKKVMIMAQWSGAITFTFPLITYTLGSFAIWNLVLVLAITGLTVPLYLPSCMAYISQILPKEKLQKANSVIDSTAQLMLLAGPALGGIFLYTFGVEVVLLSLVGLLGTAGLLLTLIENPEFTEVSKQDSWSTKFKEGISVYRQHSFLLGLALLLVILNFCKGALFPMFLPYITETLGRTEFHFGFFEASLGLGMVLGSLWVGFKKTNPLKLRNVLLGSVIIDGIFTIGLGLTPLYSLAILFIVISGFCMPIITINNTTLYQKFVEPHLLGRVFAVRILLTTIATPLGALFGGVVAEVWGINLLFSLVGFLMISVAVSAFFLPSLRNLSITLSKEKTAV